MIGTLKEILIAPRPSAQDRLAIKGDFEQADLGSTIPVAKRRNTLLDDDDDDDDDQTDVKEAEEETRRRARDAQTRPRAEFEYRETRHRARNA